VTHRPIERRRSLQNRLLRALGRQEYERLAPHLQLMKLHRGQVLHRTRDKVEHVYFPMRGICGLVAGSDASGDRIDVGPIGCEGVTGIYMLAKSTSSLHLLVQVGPAEAQRLPLDRFDEEMNRQGTLRRLVTGYYQAFLSEVVESAACTRRHSTQQRYCRRLLAIADRTASDAFFLTHDLMAAMMGVPRLAVTGVAAELKAAGIIAYTRGRVTLLDRLAVQGRACECYWKARQRIAHLLPPGPGSDGRQTV
jgi:CRP-like cAMP-binding protein